MAAAADRQMSCLFVRFKTTLFFTFVRSFGTLTNAIKSHAGETYPLQSAHFSGCSFPLFSCKFSISRELSTSFPHTSHPTDCRLANSSIRGRSPISSTIRFLASSGFLLCSCKGLTISWNTFYDILFGFPLTAKRQISALDRVQYPKPKKYPFPDLFCLIQTKATVL